MALFSGLGRHESKEVKKPEAQPQPAQKAETEVKKEPEKKPEEKKPAIPEKEFLLDKKYQCPVCGGNFTAKSMKSGKVRAAGSDFDLRPIYEGIEPAKYDVVLCPTCGFAKLSRYYGKNKLTPVQIKHVQEKVSAEFKPFGESGETYSFGEAYERYKLCKKTAEAIDSGVSEKAYINLKAAWMLRGYGESLASEDGANQDKIAELKEEEEKELTKALEGLSQARMVEDFPICGMDQNTLDFLLASLNFHFKKYEQAAKLAGAILTDRSATPHVKDRTMDLKEQIIAEVKKIKAQQTQQTQA